jgi:hypothetical protein
MPLLLVQLKQKKVQNKALGKKVLPLALKSEVEMMLSYFNIFIILYLKKLSLVSFKYKLNLI